jgi:hypothetical protein
MAESGEANGAARAGRNATLLISAHVVLFLCFIAGGALTLYAFAKNGDSSVKCFGLNSGVNCGSHHSYVPGIVLIAVGFVGNLLVMAIGARLAIGYGLGAFAHYQRRRTFMDSTLMSSSAPPGWAGGEPPGWVGGQPPGTPGSPTGPPL